MNAREIDNSSLAGLVTDAIESALAMATVQEGYAKKAGELGLQIIHKANAKAQRQIASTIRALQTERDAAETALAALTAREGELQNAATLAMSDLEMAFKSHTSMVELTRLGTGACLRLRAALQHKDDTHGPE